MQIQTACGKPLLVLTLTTVMAALCATPVRALTVVSGCGDFVAASGSLSADLDCTGFSDAALTLAKGAKLDMAGFTLTGGDADAIVCESSCSVFSSTLAKGVIQNAAGRGITNPLGSFRVGRMKARNLSIVGNGESGISARSQVGGKVRVDNSEISNNEGNGISAREKIKVTNSILNGNNLGVSGSESVAVSKTEISRNRFDGIRTNKLRCKSTRITDNQGYGIMAFIQGDIGWTVKLRNCIVDRNQLDGLFFTRILDSTVSIRDGSFSNNGGDGIHVSNVISGSMRIGRSVFDNNVGNGISIRANDPLDRLSLRDVSLTNNGANGLTGGVSERLDIARATVIGNGLHGIANLTDPGSNSNLCPVSVIKSAFVANGFDASCGTTVTCADIAACTSPEVVATLCSTSYDSESGFPGTTWGVCGG